MADNEMNGDLITLNDWFMMPHSDGELHNMFVYLSATAKDLNALGYGISSFNFNDIYVANSDFRRIKFNELNRLPTDINEKRRIVSSEIFTMVMMQVGTYSNCIQYVNSNNLVNNFSSFLPFMPQNDVMYYESIIKSYVDGETNCVYYCDYVRELESRIHESEGLSNNSKANNYVKKGTIIGVAPIVSDNKLDNAAYVSFILIPISVAIAGVLFTIISWILA